MSNEEMPKESNEEESLLAEQKTLESEILLIEKEQGELRKLASQSLAFGSIHNAIKPLTEKIESLELKKKLKLNRKTKVQETIQKIHSLK